MLTDIKITPTDDLPKQVERYLSAVDPYVDEHSTKKSVAFRGFVASDYARLYGVLNQIWAESLACGNRFCEWGSGLGVATNLAGLIGFDAYGIEYNETLVEVCEELAHEFDMPGQFACGSYLPAGADDLMDEAFSEGDGCISMFSQADDAYADIGYELSDFDLVYVFPWPNDEDVTTNIFERFASTGALLLTYSQVDGFCLRRKE